VFVNDFKNDDETFFQLQQTLDSVTICLTPKTKTIAFNDAHQIQVDVCAIDIDSFQGVVKMQKSWQNPTTCFMQQNTWSLQNSFHLVINDLTCCQHQTPQIGNFAMWNFANFFENKTDQEVDCA